MAAKFALVLLACVVAISARAPVPVQDDVSDTIKQLIIDTLSKLGDPLTVTNLDITLPENDYISGDLNVHTAVITGLSGVTIPSLAVEILGLKITGELDLSTFGLVATAHQTVVTGPDSYDNEVTADFDLSTLKISFSGAYDLLAGHVKDVVVTAKLTSAKFNSLTGFLGSDDASKELADALTENLATWVNSDTKYFPILSTVIENAINAYLDSNKEASFKLYSAFVQPRAGLY